MSAPFAEQGLDFVHLFGKLAVRSGPDELVVLSVQLWLQRMSAHFEHGADGFPTVELETPVPVNPC